MSEVRSYGKIHNLGHPAIANLFMGNVVVEEKVDGSQFSFGVIDGELKCRSKNRQIVLDAPDNLFIEAVEAAKLASGKIHPGWTYRCEYLRKPKHNTIPYARTPKNNLILFDIDAGLENYASPTVKAEWAEILDLEPVPILLEGELDSAEDLRELLDQESVLGGAKIEGVVIKNYERFAQDGRQLMGKFVSEAFKEMHQKSWGARHQSPSDIRDAIAQDLRTEARWLKAIQHLREADVLEMSPRDIGPLLKEINRDVDEECMPYVQEQLLKWARKDILRRVTRGFPEWYKQWLLDQQFEEGAE